MARNLMCPLCGHHKTNTKDQLTGIWKCGDCGQEFKLII